jgi:hypothetical protein
VGWTISSGGGADLGCMDDFSGKGYYRSSKTSRCEDLEVEEPVACGNCSSFHFHATLAGMLGPTLIGYQVVEVCQPCETRLLAPLGMMEALHREQLPLDGMMGLIQQGAGDGHLWVCEHRLPPGCLLLEPAPDALAMDRVGSKNSCSLARVVFQKPPEPFTALDRACTLGVWADRREEQHVALALMIPLVMKVLHILRQRLAE